MKHSSSLNKILIIDFGSQFTQLIARRIRELGVFSEIVSHKKLKKINILKENINGIILSGGPLNVYENNKFNFDKKILQLKIPILGICRGFQIINVCLGGKLTKDISKITKSIITKKHKVNFTEEFIKKVKKRSITVNSYHNQGITSSQLAADLVPLGFSDDGKLVEIYKHEKLPIIGIQWHPERKNFCKDFDKYIFKLFLK